MELNWKAIGRKIKGLRKEKNWDQSTLSSRSGVSVSTISTLEGGNPISEVKLAQVCEALGFPFQDLTGKPPPVRHWKAAARGRYSSAGADGAVPGAVGASGKVAEDAGSLETAPPFPGKYLLGPVLGTASARTIDGGTEFMIESTASVEEDVAVRGSFRFRVLDDSLEPLARRGWHVVCRHEDPADGELAVVDANPAGAERLVLRTIRRGAAGWTLQDPLGKQPEQQLAGRPRRAFRFIGTCVLDVEAV